MTDSLCAPRISKNVAREHNMCCNYGRSQKFVEQRRKTTASQQVKVVNELNQHLTELFTCWPPLNNNTIAVDIDALSQAIIALANQDQQRL
ncbi:unnamed protein product [Rotaria socialis]|uniref:Uncharacterized protein n=2 Tax=Rotaria socialis TaxID=392032 RepID=A0A817SS46_9BILA|nr:unnamed protein product [Rotaria socialis]CAF4397320.1 unnamed protein product [Rotaria socialis]